MMNEFIYNEHRDMQTWMDNGTRAVVKIHVSSADLEEAKFLSEALQRAVNAVLESYNGS